MVTYSQTTGGPNGKAYMVRVKHRTKRWERDFFAVDRAALLKMADELDDDYLDGIDEDGNDYNAAKEIAADIRKACGVKVDD